MIKFEYRKIGRTLVDSLADSLRGGQSVAMLGGRNVGKRYLVRRLHAQLLAEGRPVAVAAFLDRRERNRPRGHAIDRFLRGLDVLTEPEDVAAWWRNHHDSSAPGAASLLIANIDSLSRHEGIALTREIAVAGWGGLFITVEAQGASLLRDPDPPWHVDRAVVVGAFDRDDFDAFARRYLDRMRPLGGITTELLDRLYERTGGNIYFLRTLLWAVFDHWASHEGEEQELLDPAGLPDQAVASQVPWNHYLRYISRLIGQHPEVWERLECLLREGRVTADPGGPDLLELTGGPVREGGELKLPGTVVANFLQHHYAARRFAELYASQGDWDRAFIRLEQLSDAERVRPSDIDDIPDTQILIKQLSASLHKQVAAGTAEVRARFAAGCRLVLGFTEVTFWVRGPHREQGWEHLSPPLEPPPAWLEETLAASPRRDRDRKWGRALLYEVPPGEDLRVLVARIPSEHPACRTAVVIRDASATRPLSAARMNILGDLLDEFLAAYRHALQDEKFRRRARSRSQLDDVVTEILAGLGTQVLTVRHAVRLAVETLQRTRGYRRVMVALLTPDGKRICGYVEASEGLDGSLRDETDFSVSPEVTSLHVKILLEGRAIRASDLASREDAARAEAARAAITAGAFVPLDTGRFDRAGRPVLLGTLVVERADGLPPDRAEFNDLIRFGRKLAGIIEQSERVQLLQHTLNEQREPLAIFDAGCRLRYINSRSAAYLHNRYPAGWLHPESAYRLRMEKAEGRPTLLSQARRTAREAFRIRSRRLVTARRPMDGLGPVKAAWAIHANVIKEDVSGQPLGMFVEGEDLSYLHRIISALERLLRPETLYPEPAGEAASLAPDLTGRLITEIGHVFVKVLGHETVYFDELAPDGAGFIRSRRYSSGGRAADAPPSYTYSASNHAIRCFESFAPLAFYHDQRGDYDDGHLVSTRQGLMLTAVRGKEGAPGDLGKSVMWIDFPLLAGDRRLGKFVFACKHDFPPEDFELLKTYLLLLCRVVGALFELAARYEGDADKQIRAREKSARDAVENFIHHVRRPIKSLPMTLRKIRRCSLDDPGLPMELDRLEDMIRRFDHYAGLVAGIHPFTFSLAPTMIDLAELVRKALEWSAPRGRYESSPGTVLCPLDQQHMLLLLSELVENSRKYCPENSLKIRVSVEAEDGLVRLIYRDNGPGIPADCKEEVFERGKIIKRPGVEPQSGLGLHYIAQIVEGHGGTVCEDGHEGDGVRFVIELPRFLPKTPVL